MLTQHRESIHWFVTQLEARVLDHLLSDLLPTAFEEIASTIEHLYENNEALRSDLAICHKAQASLGEQTERERLLAQLAQKIRQSLNIEEILHTTVAEVRQFLQTERVFIYRFNPDWSGVVVAESVESGHRAILTFQIEDSFFKEPLNRELYQKGQIQVVEDIKTGGLSKCHIELLAQFEITANLVIPILHGEQLWGLLVANGCSSPRQWQPLEINLLKQLATQLALAIQQSTLFTEIQAELAQRKQAEHKIQEQALLLDVATDAIIVKNLDNQILFWNKGAEHLYGWTADEAINQDANNLLQNESLPDHEAASDTLTKQGHWHRELHQITKSQRRIIVSSRWTLVRDQAGEPKSILIVNSDITENKKLQAQFLRAQRLESLGTLASVIAHDFNNILTPILATAQLLPLKLPNLDPGSRQLVSILETSAKRGADLVKQILSFTQGVEGSRTIVQVQHLVCDIAQVAQKTFPKSIETETDIVPDLRTVVGDATQLHQVLMNLIVNARDAMPDGGTLNISAKNLWIDENYARMSVDAQVGFYIVITITDTGMGIPEEIIERVFDPFFTTKEVGKGTGLGLSTVIGIVKSHGGFVTMYSEVGKGSAFKVYLPSSQFSAPPATSDIELLNGNGELILVVDDEVIIGEITKATLESYNYRVLIANDGIGALALYAQHLNDISLVLLDLMMPGMDGHTTIFSLQRMNLHVKIIAMSGLSFNGGFAKNNSRDIQAFLPKPFTTETLLSTIHTVLHPTANASQVSHN
ncbi:MAG: GAF domain-containing protein [Aetokthonos hydrillicola CCALA 1050]|nr:GAF domain-containing protein [Aetokthonos hydrillicola]MBW4591020.1 GAF domain-containing protein [Aetokthonos hydrillicola CCALA 1050]